MSNEDDYFEAGKLAGFQKGSAHERRTIVAWLRELRVSAGENITTDVSNRMADIAIWIERGDHLEARVHFTDPLIHRNANDTVTLEWRDDRTATLVSREFLDDMVQAHNAANIWRPTMSDGYVGIPIEVHKKELVELGRREERATIVAWLREYDRNSPGFHNMRVNRNVARDIERGEHLEADDE